MDQILKETGLSHFGDILRYKNYSLKQFREILSAQGKAHDLRQYIAFDCGMQTSDVLAICDKL